MADYVDLLLKVPPELAKKLLNKETAEVVTRWIDARFEAFTKCPISLADSSKEETVRSMMKAIRQQKINNVDIGKLNKILKTIENKTSSSAKSLSLLSSDMKTALSQISNLKTSFSSVSKLDYIDIAINLVNLGVTVYGILYINNRLNEVQTKLDHLSSEVSQIKNLLTSELQADFHRICLNFGTMSTRIKDNDLVTRQEIEQLLTEMRVFIQRIMRNFSSGAAADIALNMIFNLLSAFTALLCYYVRDYYFEKKHLPDHIKSFIDVYSELMDEHFIKKIEDYLVLNQGIGIVQMSEAITAQKLCVLNCMLQYEDQIERLKMVDSKEEYNEIEKALDEQVRKEIEEILPTLEKDADTMACGAAIRAAVADLL